MSDEKDLLYDLLVKKAIYGLDEAEQRQLDGIDDGDAEMEFRSLEIAAAAVGLADMEIEPLPVNLRTKIAEGADRYFAEAKTIAVAEPWPPVTKSPSIFETEEKPSGSSWFGWLGWAAAVAACVALALNIWYTRSQSQPVIVQNTPPVVTPPVKTNAEMRDDLLSTTANLIKATWTAGNVQGITNLVGDIVWSDEKQAGYMTFKNLPANDPNAYTYQLWIMDKSQDNPIDGGTFNVNSQGEVVIPIDAKLKAKNPNMFAVTMEKPGGVVVSKKERIAAVAKVETTREPNT